jgi:hypothetical protein
MKKIIALAVLAFSTTFASAQNQGQRYMFTGTLNNSVALTTDCGTESTAYAYEFTVTMISDNSYTAQNIAILVECPENYGADFFKTGSSYKMEIFDASSGNFNIANPAVLSNYNLPYNYWAGDIKRIQ